MLRGSHGALAGWVIVIGALGACAAETPPATTPLTVWVYEEPLSTDDAPAPIGGSKVVFDLPGGGGRVVATTGPDGRVVFQGAFEKGGGSVTVLSSGHLFVTMLEASPDAARARPNKVGKPAEDLVVFAPRLDHATRDKTVGLRGTVTNRSDPGSAVDLAASGLRRLGFDATTDESFDLRVPRDRAFFLLGHEIKSLDGVGAQVESRHLKSFRIDVGPFGSDSARDIDLAALPALPTRPLRVRLETSGGVAEGTRAYVAALSADSDILLGPMVKSAPTADGRAFDVDMVVVETDVAPEHVVTRASLLAPDGSRSVRVEPGVAADGAVISGFAAVPTFAASDAELQLSDPIPLDGFPSGADLAVELYAAGQVFWILHGPPGGPKAKSFTIPSQDETAFSADVQLIAASISAESDFVSVGRSDIPRRVATARDLVLRRH